MTPWVKGYAAAKEAMRGELEWQRAEIERLQLIAAAAKDLIENIREHGLHDNWKATASALRAYEQQKAMTK